MKPSDTRAQARELAGSGKVIEAIALVDEAARHNPAPGLLIESIQLRHEFAEQIEANPPAELPPRITATEWHSSELVDLAPGDLTPERFRAEMAHHGCVLVRGLIEPDRAETLRAGIDRALAAFDATPEEMEDRRRWFRPFDPLPEYGKLGGRRKFMRDAGSLWAVDSPHMFAELRSMLDDTGIAALVTTILQERAVISANKFNLRRVPPGIPTNWHQDGAFLGEETRSVNLWLSLSDCGVDAPGLDIVPRRIDRVVPTGTHEAIFDWSVAQPIVDEEAGDAGVTRPRFGPGDALLFDHLFLHRTAVSDEMVNSRYAIESWFFAASTFPEGQIPVLL